MEAIGNVYKILVGTYIREKSLKGPREKLKDNIKTVLRETDCEMD
jgi:hypothetical protein